MIYDVFSGFSSKFLGWRLQVRAAGMGRSRSGIASAELPQLDSTRSAARSSRVLRLGLDVLMCRHLGCSESAMIASLVLDQPSGLLVQSYAPRLQIRPDETPTAGGVLFRQLRRWSTVSQRRNRSGVKLSVASCHPA